jgi:hypothetical protein
MKALTDLAVIPAVIAAPGVGVTVEMEMVVVAARETVVNAASGVSAEAE